MSSWDVWLIAPTRIVTSLIADAWESQVEKRRMDLIKESILFKLLGRKDTRSRGESTVQLHHKVMTTPRAKSPTNNGIVAGNRLLQKEWAKLTTINLTILNGA